MVLARKSGFFIRQFFKNPRLNQKAGFKKLPNDAKVLIYTLQDEN